MVQQLQTQPKGLARAAKGRFSSNKCRFIAYETERNRSATGGRRPGEGLEQTCSGARDETDDD
jgi:hypothetical protein